MKSEMLEMNMFNEFCKWQCVVRVHGGFADGCIHYFPTKKEAEEFRNFIAKQPTIEWTEVRRTDEL